jgi:hypothetical protein
MSTEIYYVNKNPQLNGDHEVHISTCSFLPIEANRLYLGIYSNCEDAVARAKQTYPKSNGCKTCCNACHTS